MTTTRPDDRTPDLSPPAPTALSAGSLVSRPPPTARPEETVRAVWARMPELCRVLSGSWHRSVLVTDDEGRLRGVVTADDVLGALAAP